MNSYETKHGTLEVSKCYRIKAFDCKAIYRIKVLSFYKDGTPRAEYRTFCKSGAAGYYWPLQSSGAFTDISEIVEIPKL